MIKAAQAERSVCVIHKPVPRDRRRLVLASPLRPSGNGQSVGRSWAERRFHAGHVIPSV